jgi:hypothetical protein
MKIKILFSCVIIFIFISCKKDINCGDTYNIQISTNSPVIVGWPIYLNTTSDEANLFHWTGPNGWDVNYEIHSTDASSQQKAIANLADAGLYKVELRSSEGCIIFRGTTNVQVIPPPAAPCTITNNSCSSNTTGFSVNNYTYINFSNNESTVEASGSSNNQVLKFRFKRNQIPKPGIYKSSGYSSDDDVNVGCWISAFPNDFMCQPNQSIYVNRINGKLQVAFCNLEFSNPIGSSILKVSAKVTNP